MKLNKEWHPAGFPCNCTSCHHHRLRLRGNGYMQVPEFVDKEGNIYATRSSRLQMEHAATDHSLARREWDITHPKLRPCTLNLVDPDKMMEITRSIAGRSERR